MRTIKRSNEVKFFLAVALAGAAVVAFYGAAMVGHKDTCETGFVATCTTPVVPSPPVIIDYSHLGQSR